MITLSHLVERYQPELERLHGQQLLPSHRQALRAMRRCRRQASVFRDNEVGRSTTSPLAGEVSAGDPGANAQGPGDASTTDEPPTQLVHGQTTIGQKPGGFRGGGGFLSAQCPPH
jgi:hypothetical protein